MSAGLGRVLGHHHQVLAAARADARIPSGHGLRKVMWTAMQGARRRVEKSDKSISWAKRSKLRNEMNPFSGRNTTS